MSDNDCDDTSLVQGALADMAVRRVSRRLLPWAMLMLLLSLIDRANISFAALQMNRDLGLTPATYGLAAGVFFLTYFLFEVPSNLVLVRVGARLWLARIMISWGLIVVCMAAVRGVYSFYALRMLLGIAEAGLLPGLLLYLSYWIPSRHLGATYAFLMSSTAIANVLGGPLAGGLMLLDGTRGLRGWQVMFVAEGVVTVAVGLWVLRALPDRFEAASWLPEDERRALAASIAIDCEAKAASGVTRFSQGFLDRRVLSATLVCFLFVCCNFGTVFWLPQIIGSLGASSPMQIGLLTAIPYLVGGAATILWGRHSDQSLDRRWHLVSGACVGSVGYTLAALAPSHWASFAGLCLAAGGIWSMFGVFWGYAGNLLGGAAAAGGFALINSFSTLGGFIGPVAMGLVRARAQSFSGSLLVLAGFALLTAAAALLIRNPAPLQTTPASIPT
jgi:MFS transporter, ACS family, tartrate transporter